MLNSCLNMPSTVLRTIQLKEHDIPNALWTWMRHTERQEMKIIPSSLHVRRSSWILEHYSLSNPSFPLQAAIPRQSLATRPSTHSSNLYLYLIIFAYSTYFRLDMVMQVAVYKDCSIKRVIFTSISLSSCPYVNTSSPQIDTLSLFALQCI